MHRSNNPCGNVITRFALFPISFALSYLFFLFVCFFRHHRLPNDWWTQLRSLSKTTLTSPASRPLLKRSLSYSGKQHKVRWNAPHFLLRRLPNGEKIRQKWKVSNQIAQHGTVSNRNYVIGKKYCRCFQRSPARKCFVSGLAQCV